MATGDSKSGASAGVVEVAASSSAGGFLFVGGGRASHAGHSLRPDSKPKTKMAPWLQLKLYGSYEKQRDGAALFCLLLVDFSS